MLQAKPEDFYEQVSMKIIRMDNSLTLIESVNQENALEKGFISKLVQFTVTDLSQLIWQSNKNPT